MSTALGISTDGPYDVEPQPETYATIREEANLIPLDRITPQSDVARHGFDHLANPLEAEAEARERQKTFGAFGDEHEAPAISDPVTAWVWGRLLVEHAAAKASDKIEYPPSQRTAATLVIGLGASTIFADVLWGVTGAFYIDPVTGEIHATPGGAIGFVLGLLLIGNETPDL